MQLAQLKAQIAERNRECDIDVAFYALDVALEMIGTCLNDFRDDDGKLRLQGEDKALVLEIERYLGNAQNALDDLGREI